MHPSQGGNDEIRDLVQRANQDKNGMTPLGVKAKSSGWKCPRCGEVAEQQAEAVESKLTGGAPIIRWLTDPDGKPKPVNVSTAEKVGENEDGSPVMYTTRHCFGCFNRWQRRKMMEEIRANVPVLVWEGDDAEVSG